MSLFGRLWRGETSFPATFWVGGVLGTLIFSTVKIIVFLMPIVSELIESGASPMDIAANLNPYSFVQGVMALQPTFLIFALAELGYFILMTAAIWRSGDKYDGAKVWPILAKIVLVVGWISYVYDYYAGMTI